MVQVDSLHESSDDCPGGEAKRSMPIQMTLPAKFARPDRLSSELKFIIGPGKFKVEMRHDVYTIMSAEPFELVCPPTSVSLS
jgi:hypothetical protein